MNGDEATSLFLCIQVRMMAKGFASGSYEVPRLAFVAGGGGGGRKFFGPSYFVMALIKNP